MAVRIISYGGGVQSTALVVLAATGQIDADAAVFANVGDDSEHPAALRWVREVVQPWAAERGFLVHETERRTRTGERAQTLLEQVTDTTRRSIEIPVRLSPHGAPGNRNCTHTYKIKVIDRWLRDQGVTKDNPATVLIGISTDEIQRLNNKRRSDYSLPEYPLIDLRLDRSACQRLIVDTFGEPAPKSSCWFCPFATPARWAEMRRDEPELFAQSVRLERAINEKRRAMDRDEAWLSRFCRPLDVAITEAQPTLFDGPEGCDEGYCWT